MDAVDVAAVALHLGCLWLAWRCLRPILRELNRIDGRG